jgi:hypothetical protein
MKKLVLAACAAFALAAHSANAQSLQDQQMCAAQAQKIFGPIWENYNQQASVYLQNTDRQGAVGGPPTEQSYYNDKLGVCLLLLAVQPVVQVDGPGIINITLSDAFGGRTYGSYYWSNPEHKGHVPPPECSVNFTGQKQTCNSEDEFTSLITPYFHK